MATMHRIYYIMITVKKNEDYFVRRSVLTNAQRNKAMQYHTIAAAKSPGNMPALAHVVASNYFALEAYVPAGSIIDIMRLQGRKPLPAMNNNYYIDSFLMNFAYGVEHYFDYLHEKKDQKTANKKFAKYAARMFEVIPKIINIELNQCLTYSFTYLSKDTFSKSVDGLDAVKGLADRLAAFFKY